MSRSANVKMQNLDSGPGSITHQISRIRRGDGEVTQRLFEYYFARLAVLGRRLLSSHTKRVVDEEDVVSMLLTSFFQTSRIEPLPPNLDRHDVWRLLSARLRQRTKNQERDLRRVKRGGGNVVGESRLGIQDGEKPLERVADRAEESRVHLLELHEELVACLEEPSLRSIAVLLLEGNNVADISEKLELSRATVYRKLDLIARQWKPASK